MQLLFKGAIFFLPQIGDIGRADIVNIDRCSGSAGTLTEKTERSQCSCRAEREESFISLFDTVGGAATSFLDLHVMELIQ